MQPRLQRQDGFTLIELLVVVSIIALLISLLLPALSRAALQAGIVRCQTQARQIYLGSNAYAVDAEGHYLPFANLNRCGGLDLIAMPWGTNCNGSYDARNLALQYIPDPEMFYCPDGARTSEEEYNINWGGWHSTRAQIWIGYQIVAGSGNPGNSQGLTLDRFQIRWLGEAAWFKDGILWALHENDVTLPSEATFLADNMVSDQRRQDTDPGVNLHNHPGYRTPRGSPIHIQVGSTEGFSGGNTSFFDGSVRWRSETVRTMDDPNGPDQDDYVIRMGHAFYAF